MSVNKVILVGNLGADPVIRHTASGQPVATLSVATTQRWTAKNGDAKEQTEWHRVICWGRLAENAVKYLKK